MVVMENTFSINDARLDLKRSSFKPLCPILQNRAAAWHAVWDQMKPVRVLAGDQSDLFRIFQITAGILLYKLLQFGHNRCLIF